MGVLESGALKFNLNSPLLCSALVIRAGILGLDRLGVLALETEGLFKPGDAEPLLFNGSGNIDIIFPSFPA